MSWLARAEQACVAVEVVISLYWAHDIRVYDRSRATVATPVTIAIGTREKHNLVRFGNNNQGDRGAETESCTCVYRLAVASRRGRSLGARREGRGKRKGTDFE
jgi:hypothetical protein